MLPLSGSSLPDSAASLAAALKAGLAAHGLPAREVSAAGVWPALESVRIDLTETQIEQANFTSAKLEPSPHHFAADRFEIVATPAKLQSAALNFSLTAEDVAGEFAATAEGESFLVFRTAAHGKIQIEIAEAAVEQLIRHFAAKAAGQHGVEIKATTVRLTSRGPRAVSIAAEVTAKMFIATAVVRLTGDADIDEQLNARLSNLRFDGDGMVANLAGSVIRPQLAHLEGRSFPLASFALGELRLRNLEIETGATLRLSARFGS